MDWKKVLVDRERKVNDLQKEINKLQRQIKRIGTTDPLQYLAEEIEREYGLPCRVRKCGVSHRTLVLYNKNATKKQIQHDRQEVIVGSLLAYGDSVDKLSIPYDKFHSIQFPDTLEEVYELLSTNGYLRNYQIR